ncbi:cell division protease FtsH [Parelusimicrobium proximum]|uniref:ATP-dependent zinc metalloprotease FtsH n=1 Tax=Parelusimicrobium proximum TaxID=3228953 RepID=UPI003D16F1D2
MAKKKNNNIGDVISYRQIFMWVAAIMLLVFIFQSRSTQKPVELDYSDFKNKVNAGEVSNLTIEPNKITGTIKIKEGGVEKFNKFYTYKVEDKDLATELSSKNVNFKAEKDNSFMYSMLLNVGGFVLLLLFFWFFIIRPQQGGGKNNPMSFGNTKAKMQVGNNEGITFKDVAGCDEAKEELLDIIKFLKNPKHFQRLGGQMPKGVLLYGAPGTGKTLLAKAVAGEAGAAFFYASASEFVEMFVGVGAARVRDLFEKAKKVTPSIIYIDELDAVGRRRFAGIGGGSDEREQTLNQLLIELDGFESKHGIILMASTNRPDVLDPALTRAGRFDRHVNVPAPDMKGREEILEVHAKKIKLKNKEDLKDIAKGTPGFVGADLANVVNESALLAARGNKQAVDKDDLQEAVERIIAGPQRQSRVMSEKEKKIIAYHEAGHTIVAKLCKNSDPVHKVSIIPRGPALGYTLQLPLEDKFLTTKSEILDKLCILLAGRAAEEIVFGEITTGAHDDLSRTTSYARKMIAELGMSDKLGPISVKSGDDEVFLGMDLGKKSHVSEELLKAIDDEVSRVVKETYVKAKNILNENRKALDTLVERLLAIEVVNADEIEEILKDPENYIKNIAEKEAASAQSAEQAESTETKLEQAPSEDKAGHGEL